MDPTASCARSAWNSVEIGIVFSKLSERTDEELALLAGTAGRKREKKY